ncbi:MAG: hypothetical protein PVF10_13515, partial [Syntrophobacterales bacterium]
MLLKPLKTPSPYSSILPLQRIRPGKNRACLIVGTVCWKRGIWTWDSAPSPPFWFSPDGLRITCYDRGYGRPSGRPR